MGDKTEGMKCDKCGETFPAAGEGWNGLCPPCADKAEEQNHSKDQTVSDLGITFTRRACVKVGKIFSEAEVAELDDWLYELREVSPYVTSGCVATAELITSLDEAIEEEELSEETASKLKAVLKECQEAGATEIVFDYEAV